jgi:hypothetical protein
LDKLNEYYNLLGAYPHAGIATICDPRFNYGLFNRLLSKSAENSKKAKIMSNFKNCYIEYEDQKQAIRAAKVLKEALEKPKDNSANVQDKELSNAKLYKVLLRFISTETE